MPNARMAQSRIRFLTEIPEFKTEAGIPYRDAFPESSASPTQRTLSTRKIGLGQSACLVQNRKKSSFERFPVSDKLTQGKPSVSCLHSEQPWNGLETSSKNPTTEFLQERRHEEFLLHKRSPVAINGLLEKR